MPETTTVNWIGPLIGVAVGWGLGFLSDLGRARFTQKARYNAIYRELESVYEGIKTRKEVLEEQLQHYAKNEPKQEGPATVDYPVYKRWFADTVMEFTAGEYYIISHVYTKLDHLDWQFEALRTAWERYMSMAQSVQTTIELAKIRNIVEGAYLNICPMKVMIYTLLRDKHSAAPKKKTVLAELNAAHTDAKSYILRLRQSNTDSGLE